MQHLKSILAFFAALVLSGCATLPIESARDYADSLNEKDLATSKFFLLDRPEVQKALRLKGEQLRSLASTFNANFGKRPGFTEWKERGQDLSVEEKREKNTVRMAELNVIVSTWLESQLDEILLPNQKERLESILLQMKGPAGLLTVPGLVDQVGLIPDQKTKIQHAIDDWAIELAPFRNRYGHTMLQYNRSSQTPDEFQKEQDALFLVITEILKSRDEEILSVLTPSQRDEWTALLGQPIPVQWPPHAFFYTPFQMEEPDSNKTASPDPKPQSGSDR